MQTTWKLIQQTKANQFAMCFRLDQLMDAAFTKQRPKLIRKRSSLLLTQFRFITLICTLRWLCFIFASIDSHLVGFASITFFGKTFYKTFHISKSFDWASLYCSVKLASWMCKDVENKQLVSDWVLSNRAKTVRSVRREINQQESAKLQELPK